MTKEDRARIYKLEQTLEQMETKAKFLSDDIEYIKGKLAMAKIEAEK